MKAWLNRKHGGRREAVEIAMPEPKGTKVFVDVTYYGSLGVVRQPGLENPTAMGHETRLSRC